MLLLRLRFISWLCVAPLYRKAQKAQRVAISAFLQ
jgi:hypothetical protein